MVSCPDPIFHRRLLTNYLLDLLRTECEPRGVLVGDGVAPDAGGWTGGQPPSGTFRPYLVVSVGAATQLQTELTDVYGQWVVNYQFATYGGTRDQCEWAGDIGRYVLPTARLGPPADVGEQLWSIPMVTYQSMGSVRRNDSVSPPYWQSEDAVSLRVIRTRSPGSATIPLAAQGG